MATMPSAFPALSTAGGAITGNLTVTGTVTANQGGGSTTTMGANYNGTGLASVSVPGNLQNNAAGSGVKVHEGANAKQGTAVLVGGTVTVSNTTVTANSRIFLTSQADGGTPGFLRVTAITPGTSFVITSSSGTDTSTVAYEIFEPG